MRQTWRLLLLTMALTFAAGSASAAYVNRYATTTRGGVTFTGNALGLSRATGNGGLTAPGNLDSIGAFSTTNTALQVGTYPAGTTADWHLDGASAVLVIPAGSAIIHAELIWGASLVGGPGEDITSVSGSSIGFVTPANATVNSIAPDPAASQTGGNLYVRAADVTALVQAAGAGTYTVSGVPGTRGANDTNNAAGWTLAVVYGNASLAVRNMTIFAGAEVGGSAAAGVNGFCTPPTGTVNGRVLVSALEGDASRTGDTFLFGPTTTLGAANLLSGANNPINNFFVSQINSDSGALDTTGTFGTRNHNALTGTNIVGGRQGWDITNVSGSAQLTNNQTSAFAQGTTTGDQYTIAALGLQIDVFAPSFPVTVKQVNRTSTFVGDTITYTITLNNNGSSTATNVVFNDPVPANTSFVAGSFTIDGVPQPAVLTPVGVAMGSIANGSQKVVTFQVNVNSLPASHQITNSANWTYGYAACSATIPGTVTTNQVVVPMTVADVAITKTDGSATATPGATVSYTIVASNSGSDTATGANVLDTLPASITGATWSVVYAGGATGPASGSGNINALVNLPPASTATFTVVGTVSPSATGTLDNTATITPPAGITDPNTANNTATDSDTLSAQANLGITKTDGVATATPGGAITYTIVASNAGPSTATGATVADTIPASITGATWSVVYAGGASGPASGSGNINALVNLPSGGSATFTVNGTVSAAATGTLANTATITAPAGVTDPTPANNSATDTDTLTPSANLGITKTDGSATATPGSAISYTIVASNAGPSTATGATVADPIPASITGATWTAVYAGGASGPANGSGSINAAVTLPAGGTATFTLSGTVSATATGSLVNTATITAPGGVTDPTPGNNSATDTDTLNPQASLSITKTDSSASATPGSTISYTIVASNAGPSTATGATVVDTLPASITGATWTAAYAGGASGPPSGSGNINATVTLPSGGSATFTLTGTVSASASGSLANTATITAPAGVTDPTPGDNSATDTDTLNPRADLAITKTDGAANATPGSAISYTIVATNSGPSTATGATVADSVPASITGAAWTAVYAGGATGPANGSGSINATVTIPSGGTATFTLSGTVSSGAIGALVNTATVTAPAGTTDPNSANNTATDTDTLNPSANLSITKTDGSANYTPGGAISYSIVAGNTGPSAVTGATVADTVPAAITGATWTAVYAGGASGPPSGSGNISAAVNIPVGGSATFTLSGTVSASATGPLANTATIAVPAGTTDPTPGNNSDTDTDTASPQANLGITKTDGSANATPGSAISYTIVASNTGPSNVTGATVADTIPAGITGATWTAVYAGGASGPANGSGNIAATVNIPVGGTATFTVNGTVSPTATGSLTNTATIAVPAGTTDPTPGNNTSTDTDTLTPRADLAITKTDGAANATPGSAISYTIVASNAGPSTATGATIADTIPASITGATWTAVYAGGASGPASGSGNIAATVTIPSGGTATFTVNGTVSASATGTLVNTATVTAPAGTTDPNNANNSATDTDTLSPSANLAITKTDSATTATPGSAITYTIVATNTGPSTATGATVTDTLPATITGATWTAVYAGGASGPPSGSGNIAATVNIPVGGTATFTLTGTVSAAATGTLANTATITAPAGTTDPTPGNNSATDTDTLNASADISAVKTGPASVGFGGALSYSVVVTNNGPSNANGTTFSDTVPAAITAVTASCGTPTGGAACGAVNVAGNAVTSTITTLPSGSSVTFTINGTAPTSGASVTNSATANPPTGTTDPTPGNNTGTSTTNLLQPQLTVTKTATPNPFTVGQPASYTITVANTGAGPTSGNITVADTLASGLTLASFSGTGWNCTGTTVLSCTFTGTIAAGNSAVLTLNVNVGAGAANANNSATASGGGDPTCPAAGRCTGTTTVPVNASADIAVTKSVDNAAPNVGENVTFTVTATNNGPNNATGVAITDALPSGLLFVSATPSQGTYVQGTGVWTVGAIANGNNATLAITATVLTPGSITNTATKTAGNQFDPNTGNNAGSAMLNANPSADLQVTKLVNNAAPNLGTNVTYTITVHNAGPNDATNVTVDDLLPLGMNYVSSTASQGTYNSGAGIWTVGAVNNGATVTLTITATVTLPGDITNTATVDADQHDPNTANNTSGATLNGQSADIQVVKGVDNANPVRGDTVTFTITATNNGPSNATGVQLTDVLPAGLTFVSATPSQGTYVQGTGVWTVGNLTATGPTATATLTIVADVDTDSGFTNTASLTALDQTDPNLANNSSSVVVTPIASADIEVVKTGPANATAGQPVIYTLAVTNHGPSPAANVSLADPTPAGLTFVSATAPCTGGFPCNLGTLASGATASVTVTFAVPSNATGPISNTATVSSPTGDPTPTNNSSTVSTPVVRSADLEAVKTGPASVTANAAISYSVVVTNLGPSDANGAAFSDPVPAGITAVNASCGTPTGGAVCGTVNVAGNAVTSTITTLPTGASVTFTINGTAPGDTASLANTASVAPPTGVTDPINTNNTSTVTTGVNASADVAVVKTGPASATAGQTVGYTLAVTNNGPSAAANVSLADPTPAGLTFVSASAPCAGGFPCNLGTLANAATATITATFAVPAGASGAIVNTATVSSATPDPTPANNSSTVSTPVARTADLVAVKTGPSTVTAAGAISYSVVVSNAGPSDVANATFSDPVPAGITAVNANCGTPTGGATCGTVNVAGNTVTSTITSLPAGGSVTFTINGSAPAEPTTFANTASVAVPVGTTDPNPTNNSSSVSTSVGASADVSIVKSGPATVSSGATITYTLLISNAGPSAANGATYADAVPAAITGVTAGCGSALGGATCATPTVAGNNVSGNVPTLPAGGSVLITISGTAPFGAQTFANTATVTSPAGVPDPDTANNTSSTSTTIGAAADIALTKSVDNTAPNVGQTVTFTIVASNNGPNDATGVIVTDNLPFGFGFVSAAPSQGTYAPATGMWTIGALANGDSVTLTIVAMIEQPGGLTNTVAVSASDQPDPNTSNNNAGASVNGGASADISVAKSVDDATPNVGDTITYTITASNNGPNDATGVEITDNLPAGVAFVSATPSQGTYDSGSGVWSVGALANGANGTLLITVTVTAPGAIVNVATITHEDQFDPVSANNQAGTTINGQQADLAVTKTVDNASPNVGDAVTFTITVHNNGPSDATNVALTDVLPANLTFVSQTTSQGTYSNLTGLWTVGSLPSGGTGSSATLTIVANVSAAGSITNTAAVSASDQTDPNSANNSASVSLNGNPLADLMVEKGGPATVTPGDTIAYTVVVTNNGPSAATNVLVTDTTPAGLVFVGNTGACTSAYPCTIASLANGASVTITSTYTVPANYAGANPIINTANVTSEVPDPNSTNNQGSANTNVGPGNADLAIVKSGPATVASGGAITYTLTISNNGPSPANDATYNDVVPAAITAVSASCGGEAGGAACVSQPIVTGNNVTGAVGSLPSGGSVVVTIIGIAPTGPANVSNTATIDAPAGIVDPNGANNTSTVATAVAASSADLEVIKDGPAQAVPGTNVTYSLTITNNGPDTATNVVLNDATPAGLTFVSASIPCASGFPCSLDDLPSGASTIVAVTFAVDANATGSIVNTATAASDTPDPNANNNSSTVTTPLVPVATSADLAIVKTGPASATPGSNVTYSLQVINNGPDAAANVVLSDATPAGLTFVSASAPCATGFPCSLGTLGNGASTIVTVTFAVSNAATGSIVNTATATSDTPDPDGNNNVSTVSTTVTTPALVADLSIVKSGPTDALAGSTITYTIVVTNNGPDAVPDPVLSDVTPAGLSFVSATGACSGGFPCTLAALANGASTTITATYQVQPGFTGTIANVASVASNSVPDPTPNNNSGTATTIVRVVGGIPVRPVPVDARWMLMLMAGLLMLVGAPIARRYTHRD